MAQIWSPYLYDSRYSPQYTVAFATNSVMAAMAIAGCLVLRWCLARENRKMDVSEADREVEQNGVKNIRYVL